MNSNGKVVIITFGAGMFNFSANSIAAHLRERDHQTTIIQCVPTDEVEFNDIEDIIFIPISNRQLDLIAEHCHDADVVGISILTTHYLRNARRITEHLRDKLNCSIIWGGVPIVAEPDFYLEYVDYVCIGEGEVALDGFVRHIVSGTAIETVQGIAYRDATGEIRRSGSVPLFNGGELPLPLFDFDNHYILGHDLRNLSEDKSPLLDEIEAGGYRIFAIRGCPFSCTFCVNDKLNRVYKGQKTLRGMSNNQIVEELLWAKQEFPLVKRVMFYEDDFFARTNHDFADLMKKYKKYIDLPITFNATIKLTSEKKIDIMLENGIEVEELKVGLQTGSERVNREIYGRDFSNDEFIEKVDMLLSKKIPVQVDIISANPFEEFRDKVEALKFYSKLTRTLSKFKEAARYFAYLDHKLMFYPGTSLYEKAMKAGIIDDHYVDEVLLTRRTIRRPTEVDIDRIILGLFNLSMKHKYGSWLMLLARAPLVLRFLGTYPLRKLAYWLYFGLGEGKKPFQLKLVANQTYNAEAGGWVSR